MVGIRGSLMIVLGFLFALAQVGAAQQPGQTPQQYSVTEINALFGPAMTVQIYRDGQRAMQDSSGPPAQNFPKGMHTRTYYDLSAGKQYTIDLTNPSSGCGTGTFSGDWGDPFSMSTQMMANDPNNAKAKALGTETIAGVPSKGYEATDPSSKADVKYWIDDSHHLIMKLTMASPGAAPKTVFEVKQVSYAKPAASLLVVPANCVAAAASAPPSDDQRIAAETGGNAANYANAIMPPRAKSTTACNVLLKVVQAGNLQPVTGFKIGVDLQIDPSHMPGYQMGGAQTFSGGHIQNMTAQIRNGAIHIANAPSAFDVELLFSDGGSSALIYRQCFGPETTLLFVVKDPQNVGKGGDWLWAKK